MPIHLESFKRRDFLGTMAGAGASILMGRSINLEATMLPAQRETWTLLSDTHVASDAEKSWRGVCMARNLNRAVSGVVNRREPAAGVIVNGDCAHLHGQGHDYQTFSKLIDPIADRGVPVHLLMGNHDNLDPFYEVLGDHQPDRPPVRRKHVGVVKSKYVNWFLLDSNMEENHFRGEFGVNQLEWLSRELDRHADKPAIIMGHHHPRLPVLKGGARNLFAGLSSLKDTDDFLDLVHSKAHVQAYVYGHTHHWHVGRTRQGVYLINLPPVAYVFNPVCPSGWIDATVGPRGMELELSTIDPRRPENRQRRYLPWRDEWQSRVVA